MCAEIEEVSNPHDTRYKALFGNKKHFLGLLKDCVKPDWLDDLDIASLRKSEKSFILQDFSKKEADVVYEAILNGEKVIFYILLELQSSVDYEMPYRLLLYITEILRQYRNAADENEREQKGFKLPAVIPMVFFSGSEKWSVPTSFKKILANYEKFGSYILDFDYLLIDVKGYTKEDLKKFSSKLLGIVLMLEKAKNDVEFYEYLRENVNEIKGLNKEDRRILNMCVDIMDIAYGYNQSEKIKEIFELNQVKEVNGMLVDMIENAKKEREELIEKGVMKKAIEAAQNLLKMGDSIEKVSIAMELPIEKVQKIKDDMVMV